MDVQADLSANGEAMEIGSRSFDGSHFGSGPLESEDSYTRVKVLGRGAFGEAVLYRKTLTNELVVWKEIDLVKASDEEKSKALNEVEVLSQLDHFNIVSYYNHFFDGSSLFIEMEYANGGTLHHKILSQNGYKFSEEDVCCYFYQLMSAIAYIHEFGILHRDIKTLNIFLTKGKAVKLGDFGISKVLEETFGMASTAVGTPYYMSPEIIRGESYNQKSDIWACGCVLYELMTLTRVFDGTNQLNLIHKILEVDHGKVSGDYSSGLCSLVDRMLEKDPAQRPSAEQVIHLPVFSRVVADVKRRIEMDLLNRSVRRSASLSTGVSNPVVASLSSEVYFWGGGKLHPQKLEAFGDGNSGLQVSSGFSHFAVTTIEKELWTWTNVLGGSKMCGQLGHGDTAMYRQPKKVTALEGIAMKMASCGEDFTIALSEGGEIYAFGSDYWGCIGCGNQFGESVRLPVKVASLQGIFVESISCGDSHVVALTNAQSVYTWGCGEYGRLGLGSEESYATPQLLQLPAKYATIVQVACGHDNTVVLASNGKLLAFGSNEDNKLALNQMISLSDKRNPSVETVHCSLNPTPVGSMKSYRIVGVGLGKSHSAVVDEFGRLLTFGNNRHGQLGVGDHKPRLRPSLVNGNLSGKEVLLCACGDGFTVAATSDNHVFAWGSNESGRSGLAQSVASPQPIFGSMHKVASLSCRYWSTIMLAERVHSSKVIRTQSLAESVNSSSSFQFNPMDFSGTESGICEAETSSYVRLVSEMERNATVGSERRSTSLADSDAAPAWLQKELDGAEVIPWKEESSCAKNSSVSNGSRIPAWLDQELAGAEFIPMKTVERALSEEKRFSEDGASKSQSNTSLVCSRDNVSCVHLNESSRLEIRVKELELENIRLRKVNRLQEIRIKVLEREKEAYMATSKKLLELTRS